MKTRGAVWYILLLETVMVAVLLWRSMPAAVVIAAWKKSKTLLLSMTLPVLLFGLADPSDMTPLVGSVGAGRTDVVIRNGVAAIGSGRRCADQNVAARDCLLVVDEPRIEQLVMRLFCAPAIKRIVLVPAVAATVVFEIVSELPPLFKPSMVTLSAPFRSINGKPAVAAPETFALRSG